MLVPACHSHLGAPTKVLKPIADHQTKGNLSVYEKIRLFWSCKHVADEGPCYFTQPVHNEGENPLLSLNPLILGISYANPCAAWEPSLPLLLMQNSAQGRPT